MSFYNSKNSLVMWKFTAYLSFFVSIGILTIFSIPDGNVRLKNKVRKLRGAYNDENLRGLGWFSDKGDDDEDDDDYFDEYEMQNLFDGVDDGYVATADNQVNNDDDVAVQNDDAEQEAEDEGDNEDEDEDGDEEEEEGNEDEEGSGDEDGDQDEEDEEEGSGDEDGGESED
mmetsp:Transcript_10033/g.14190  ORF Transcript_10033/g.14190 Transcript_10033/m.14190 type:complete len:171 (-) Transcript_10033:167-679(-)